MLSYAQSSWWRYGRAVIPSCCKNYFGIVIFKVEKLCCVALIIYPIFSLFYNDHMGGFLTLASTVGRTWFICGWLSLPLHLIHAVSEHKGAFPETAFPLMTQARMATVPEQHDTLVFILIK